MNTYIKTIFILAVAAWLACCNMGSRIKPADCDEILLNSFISNHVDSMIVAPYAAMDIYKKMRENTSDSISSYSLLLEISDCYAITGDTDSAMMINRKVIDYCEREKVSPCLFMLQAEAYIKYSTRMVEIENTDSAIVYTKKALDAMMKSGNRQRLPNIYSALGSIYQTKSDFSQASHYYQRTLFVIDSLKMGNRIRFLTLHSLAKLYSDIENIEQAEYYFQQAEKFLDEMQEWEKIGFINNKAVFYTTVGKDYQKGLEYHQNYNRYIQADQSGYFSQPQFFSLAAANLGEVFLLIGQTDSARYYIDKAKDFYKLSAPWHTLEFYISGLNARLALLENKLNEAEKILLKQMLHNISSIEPSIIHYHHQQLEELYARKNDFKNAYQYRLKVNAYDDSLRNTKVRNNVAEMEMRYRQDTTLLRKDLRIAVVEKSASRWQSIAWLSLLLLVLLAAAAGAFILYTRRKREQEYRKQVAIVTGLRMEIVRNRVSPHFVFNALNVMMPSLDQHRELERPFRLLIQMLRNNLRASEQVAVPLEEEIDLVKNFLLLQEIGDRQKITVDWQVADDVPIDARIPSMSIQIPVENAVKYAFTSEQEDARITIRITMMNNMIGIVIDDNGVGFQPGVTGAFSERGTGSGLKMLRRTVELLNTRNQYQMAFSIENKNSSGDGSHGTRVSIVVPLEYQFEMQ